MPEINYDGGDFDMRTEATEAAAQKELAATATFDQAWLAACGVIDNSLSGIGGIGSGPLGADFLAKYNPAAERIGEFVKEVITAINGWSADVSGSVRDYLNADYEGARWFDQAA